MEKGSYTTDRCLLFVKLNSDGFDTGSTETQLTGGTSWLKQKSWYLTGVGLKEGGHKCKCKHMHDKSALSVQMEYPAITPLLQRNIQSCQRGHKS